MSALPPALRPWAAELEPFDDDIARALGGYLLRLAAAFGELGHGRRGAAEPDGFGGIGNRGPYESLLATEWLLHDELPDEFLRRAAMGEQLFLQRSFAEPQKSRHVFVLLDTGCEQLGAPRLVHLAWLILQKQRAEAAHAAFSWGVIQRPHAVNQELAPSRVESMLRDSEFRLPTHQDLGAWSENIRTLSDSEEECEVWCVGGPRLRLLDTLPQARFLCIEPEQTRGGSPRLEVGCFESVEDSKPKRTLHLDVPAAELAVRILREPMNRPIQRPVGKGPPLAPHTGLVLHTDQKLAWAVTADGRLLTQSIPQSIRSSAPHARLTELTQYGRAVAVGYSPAQKRSLVLCSDGTQTSLLVLGKRGGVASAQSLGGDGIPLELQPGARLGQLFLARSDLGVSRAERAETEEYLCVFADRLFHLAWGSCNLLGSEEIVGFASARHGVLLAQWRDRAIRVVKAKLSTEWAVRYDELGPPLEDLGGPMLMSAEPHHTRRAYLSTSGKWMGRDAGLLVEMPVPEGARPRAILHGAFGPELLTIGADKTRLFRINPKGESLMLRFKHPIADLAAAEDRLVVLTEAGQLFAYQLSPLAQLVHYESSTSVTHRSGEGTWPRSQ